MRKNQIDHHIFNGSVALIAVCLTVISLFKVTKTGVETYADEMMGVATMIFILAAFLSYSSLRNENNSWFEKIADILFFLGLLLMLVSGAVILFY
jgi:hypothetical protein